MTLKDTMADDVTSVFLNTDEFADDAQYFAKGCETPFALVVVLGDPQPGLVQIQGGKEDRRPVSIVAARADFLAGMSATLGKQRDPIRGDKVVIAAGANAGSYLVETAHPDVGGAININAAFVGLYAPGAQTARELR